MITALINTNLRQQPLKHCLEVTKCKAVIYSPETTPGIYFCNLVCVKIFHFNVYPVLIPGLAELQDENKLPKVPTFCYGHGGLEGTKNLSKILAFESGAKPKGPKTSYKDPLYYIYTSGTTGLPKAAIIRHSR